uniref:ORF1 n=1 Tax=Hollyhock leaf crumple virus satellite DNA beta TaxID=574217 RepID=B8XX96_9VIRU|nr:ORF1 [Hollyhock leaf crumple virus satellite DNA beta]
MIVSPEIGERMLTFSAHLHAPLISAF